MDLNHWLSAIACGGHIAIALFVIARGARGELSLRLALLNIDFFAWNFASLAYDLSNRTGWFYLERATSPFSAPLALHVIAAFAGRARRLRRTIWLSYVPFGAISGTALLAFLSEDAAAFTTSRAWAAAHLSGVVLVLSFAFLLMLRQVRTVFDRRERNSSQLVLAALLVGGVLAPTELLADLGLPVPRLGHIGTLCSCLLFAAAVLRFRLLETDLSLRASVQAGLIGTVAIVAYLAVFWLLASNTAMVVWGTATVTLALVIATRAATATASSDKERVEHLATLGRFSAQMAHDLKNPLAALKGAIQYLLEEARDGRRIESRMDFMLLLEEQVERMERIVDQYQRLGRVEPIPRCVDLNSLVRRVLAMQALATKGNVTVRRELHQAPIECKADGDLIAGALENLVRNAIEAMPHGGTLTVRTHATGEEDGEGSAIVAVEDSGVGMDARVQERAFDDFFTTKASGSGLGLAFVRRVAEAHGGGVNLKSVVGRGTSVWLRIPMHTAP